VQSNDSTPTAQTATTPDMKSFWDSDKRKAVMAPLEPFYVNQFTTTHCEVV